MSSPFSSVFKRVVPAWSKAVVQDPSPFVPYNPFGTFSIDLGYGSGGYGDLPYGQGVMSKVTYSTDWTRQTAPGGGFISVAGRVVPIWLLVDSR